MSEDIEQDQHHLQEDLDHNADSVPVTIDKDKIEAIFVGGVPADVDEVYLQDNFQKFGEIKSVKIINSTKTKKPKRFAIVTFNQPISSAILSKDHWMIGRKVEVKEYLTGEEANIKLNKEKQRKIFVGGLPLSVNNEILKSYFQQFGKVIEANIVYNHETMKSRGFGFVIFEDEHTVQEVLNRYDDHHIFSKWIDCKPALLKDEVVGNETPTKDSSHGHMMTQQMGRGGHGGNPHGRQPIGGMKNHESRSQDRSEEDKPKMNQLPGVGAKKKLQVKPENKRGQEDHGKIDGSENGDSQTGSQGRPNPYYDFGGYGMAQAPPYSYSSPGYNYQMQPHSMGHGYNLYTNHHPMGYDKMNQRGAPKQYGYSGYNYQDRGSYPQTGMRGAPAHHDYYEGYNYEEGEMGQMRTQQVAPQQSSNVQAKAAGGEYPRPDKQRQKPVANERQAGFAGYQYGQPMSNPMYPNVHTNPSYEPRGPYEYNDYKTKPVGESGMGQNQQAFYNYRNAQPTQPYSYGNNFKGTELNEAQDADKQMFREDGGAKGGKKVMVQGQGPQKATRPPLDDGKNSGNTKPQKPRQFAEDDKK